MTRRRAPAIAALVVFCVAGSSFGAAPATFLEVVRESVAKSPEASRARLEALRSSLEEPRLLSNLDTRFQADYLQQQDRAPRDAPAFQGAYSRRETYSLALRQRTLLGTDVGLTWLGERLESPAAFRTIDPSASARLSLDLRQSLLKNFWGRPDRALRARARAGARATQWAARAAAESAAMAAARAYAETAFAEGAVGVAEEGVRLADRLLATYRDKSAYGLTEPSDIAQAQSLRESQALERDLALAARVRARNRLASLLDRIGDDPLVSSELPAAPAAPSDLEAALRSAREERLDVRRARARAEAAGWAERLARLDRLPEFAVLGSMAYAGLDRGPGAAATEARRGHHPVVTAGVSLDWPLRGRRERLDWEEARIALEDAREDVRAAERALDRDVRDAWENWRFQSERRAARRRIAEIERQKLDAEARRFRQGRSTTDLVVRSQQDVVRAGLEVHRSDADEFLARLELLAAAGRLSDALGLP